jgi:hypothetical protein
MTNDVEAPLARLDEALEELSVKLGALLPRLSPSLSPTLSPSLDENATREVIALLHERDRIEQELLALGLAANEVPGRMTFDLVVRPQLWRLVAINDVRREMVAKIAPEDRARFYWWSEGSAIDPVAASALPAVAHLVATFPDAQRRFEVLVQAQAAWTSPKPKVATGVVRTLRGFLNPRLDVDDDLALAAAPTDERTVLTTSDVEISFASPNLILDLLSDRREGAVPSIVTAQGERVLGEAVSGAEERFAFVLSAKVLDSSRLVIVVPLASGDVEIVLPS